MTIIADLEKKLHENTLCSLCEEPILRNGIFENERVFCCHGCQAVHNILESQSQLHQKKDHPLLKQAVQYGLISNPSLIEKIRAQEASSCGQSLKWIGEIDGMWCPSCGDLIRLVLGGQRGVICCYVDYATDLAQVQYDPQKTSKEKIQKEIANLGFCCIEFQDHKDKRINDRLNLRWAIAAFFALNVMMFTYPLYTTYFDSDAEGMKALLAWISFALTLPVLLYSGVPIFKRCWVQIKQGVLAMETLAGLGIAAALLLSFYEMARASYHVYFDTITVLIAFLLLGKIIESKAKFSSKEALLRLHHALPRKGRKVFSETERRFIPLKDVQIGDLMAVYSGERVPLDGIIVEGEGSCNESVLTGEPVPIFKHKGDLVLSGALLETGSIQFQAVSQEKNSTLHRILDLALQEIGQKTPYVRAADHIVKWFTPCVLAIAFFAILGAALLGYPFLEAFARGIAVVLIACPCAIGIAAPLVESQIIHRFAEKGALVKNRALLALLPKITHFVFDKTGTITEGRFQVLQGLDILTEKEKQALKGLCKESTHPIAKALHEALPSIASAPFFKIREIAGRGMEGENGEGAYFLGSRRFIQEKGHPILTPSEKGSTVYFFNDTKLLSTLLLGDTVRTSAKEMLEALNAKKILLSGDHTSAVAALARTLPFDEWHAEYSPLDKQEYVRQLKEKGFLVAMIGDGINDAPALAKADAGISVVSATDISIQVSDLFLTSDRLTLLPELIVIAKKGSRLIRQNLFWAFFYNVLGVGLAAFGLMTPLFASFAMIISSLIVLLNAKRLSNQG
jgi:heavy metal translocating P-type ATPase